jgi:hypothetical protein
VTGPARTTPPRRPVALLPVGPDQSVIFETLTLDTDTMFRARYRGSALTLPPASPAEAWAGVYCHYAVVYRLTGRPLGLVTAYGADFRAGHVYLAALALPRWQRTGLVAVGSGMLLHRLLTHEPFQKVYLDIAGYNLPQLRDTVERVFRLEASLPGFFYYDGRHWDRLIYSVTRHDYADSPWFAEVAQLDAFDERSLPELVSYA